MENMFRFEFRILFQLVRETAKNSWGLGSSYLWGRSKRDPLRTAGPGPGWVPEFLIPRIPSSTVLKSLSEFPAGAAPAGEHGCNVVIPSVVARRNKPGQILQRYIVMVCYNEAGQILQRYNTGGLGADDSKSSRHGVSPFRTRWRKFTSCYAAALSD